MALCLSDWHSGYICNVYIYYIVYIICKVIIEQYCNRQYLTTGPTNILVKSNAKINK